MRKLYGCLHFQARAGKKAGAVLLAFICILNIFCMPVYAEESSVLNQNVISTDENSNSEENNVSEENNSSEENNIKDGNVTSEKSLKVLFIGNSFTKYPGGSSNNIGTIFAALAESSGKNVEVETIAHNAAHLSYYAFLSETYKSYYQEASNALMNRQWDYIVLQDYSTNGIQKAENEMYPAIRQLNNLVLKYQKNAKVLLYATHGYNNGTATVYHGKSTVLTIPQMQKGVAAAYDKIGKELNLTVVPVGMMFWHCNRVYPAIPLYSADLKHPSYAGYYLAACTFYYEIFHEIPKGDADRLKGCDLTGLTMQCLENLVDDRAAVSVKEATVTEGSSLQLRASTVLDSGYMGAGITWESVDGDIASVNASSGKITGVTAGTTQIIAETASGLQDICTVHVTEDSGTGASGTGTSMRFQQASYKVTYGDTIALLPSGYFSVLKDNLTWTSSNKTVAVVSAGGTVTTVKPGKTTITVKRKDTPAIKASYVLYVACKAPKQVKATAKTGVSASSPTGKITVKWNKSYGATSYIVYRASAKNGTYKKIAAVTTTSYTDAGAVKNKNWYYKVVAKAGYTSTVSSKSSCSTAMMVLTSPQNVKASSGKKTLKITWKKNSKANGYIVYRSAKKNSGYKRAATIKTNSKVTYTDKTAKKGKTYYYRIKAYKKISGKYYYSTSSKTLKAKL